MRMATAKKSSDIKLHGITAELDVVNESIKGLILRDGNGGMVRVAYRDYAVSVEIPAPPKTEKRWRVHGNLLGVEFCKDFEDKYKAKQECDRLKLGTRDESDATLTVEEVDVVVPE